MHAEFGYGPVYNSNYNGYNNANGYGYNAAYPAYHPQQQPYGTYSRGGRGGYNAYSQQPAPYRRNPEGGWHQQ